MLKKLKRVLTGKDFFYKTTPYPNTQKIGSNYGGWWIEKNSIEARELIVLSFGLGEDISFDTAMMEEYPCTVYGFDPTPKSITYVESLKLSDSFKLHKYALSNQDGSLTFHLPKNEDHVSGSLEAIPTSNIIEVACKRLSTICDELSISTIDILKMDIEGSEYKVIEDILESSIFLLQILIEYHHFFDNISNKESQKSIELLLNSGYELFHIDGYNYSFIKKEIVP